MRSEKVDTRGVLNGDVGDANFTNPCKRLLELERIRAYWPDKVLRPIAQGYVSAPPWRLLLDPTAWHDVEPKEVHEWVYRHNLRGSWPSLDGMRKKFGRVSNHRGADEVPEQKALFITHGEDGEPLPDLSGAKLVHVPVGEDDEELKVDALNTNPR